VKNPIASLFRFVLQFRHSRRARVEERISPEQLRDAAMAMLRDPQTRQFLASELAGALPPSAGSDDPGASTVTADAAFGSGQAGTRNFIFSADAATTTPLTVEGVVSQSVPLQQWKDSGGNVLATVQAAGNVGIGVLSPDTNLVVKGDGSGSARIGSGSGFGADYTALSLNGQAFSGGANYNLLSSPTDPTLYICRPVGSAITFRHGLTTQMELEANGRLGIGTTQPAVRLHVVGGAQDDYELRLEAAAGRAPGLQLAEGQALRGLIAAGGTVMSIYTGALDVGQAIHILQLNGNVGIGIASPQAKLDVQGRASFTASGTVSVTKDSDAVTGSGFLGEINVGDRVKVTINYPDVSRNVFRTVISVAPNGLSLTVDQNYDVTASGLSMTVFPSIIRADDPAANPQFTVTGDGHLVIGRTDPSKPLSGFLGLAGSEISDDDATGYIICNADVGLVDKNEEIRGYEGTMRYTRTQTSPDANVVYGIVVNTSGTAVTRVQGPWPSFVTTGQWSGMRIDINGVGYVISSVTDGDHLTLTTPAGTQTNAATAIWQTTPTSIVGDGWDVRPFTGAVSLEKMNLPSTDPYIRGQMKPFQSELWFGAKATAESPNYSVVAWALNYVASLERVDSTYPISIAQWAGFHVATPCGEGGAAGAVANGYGVWVRDLDDGAHTLVQAGAAAMQIDGLNEYGRIRWGAGPGQDATKYSSIYQVSEEVSPGSYQMRLELGSTGYVRTAQGVGLKVGGAAANAGCDAGSYSVAGTEIIDGSGNISTDGYGNFTGYVDTYTGFRVSGWATPGHYLRGNNAGYFVDSAIYAADIPGLDASKITTGQFASAQIPSLDASKITTGQFASAQIPGLDASKITSGQFGSAQIPNLDASKITTGALASDLFGDGIDTSAGIDAGSYSLGGSEIIYVSGGNSTIGITGVGNFGSVQVGSGTVITVDRQVNIRVYSGGSFPSLSEHEVAFWWDGTNFWLVGNSGVNLWKVQMTQQI
jgi:hypothetical protein